MLLLGFCCLVGRLWLDVFWSMQSTKTPQAVPVVKEEEYNYSFQPANNSDHLLCTIWVMQTCDASNHKVSCVHKHVTVTVCSFLSRTLMQTCHELMY